MRRILPLALLVCLLLAFVVTAFADDNNPPPWRGGPRTTFQQWEFTTPDVPALLEQGWNNIYGTPQLQVWPGPGMHWVDVADGRQGIWPLSGLMQIVIPNAPDHPDWTKTIWLQLTWHQQDACMPLLLADSKYEGQVVEQDVVGGTTGPGWFHTTYQFILPYNPRSETILISGDIMVDEVVVDTVCVPEPSSLLALATCVTGLAGLAWKKRS